jgi:hypothetical protein
MSRALCVGLALLLPASLGCGKGTVRVRGTLTLDGTPVEGATVLFLPEDEKVGRQASAVTASDGTFHLTTFRGGDGALPGNYKVVVQYAAGVEGPPARGLREAFTGMQKAQKGPRKPPRYVLPPAVSDPAQTPLRQKVPPDGPVTLNLKSK